MKRSNLLVILALAVSSFTHIWNAAGYPIDVDEGFYLGRAVMFLDTLNPVLPSDGYDHPYFGQILLSGYLYLVGYQNFLAQGSILDYSVLLLVPRIFMGLLAVLDTFLIFKIVEIHYTKSVAFIASILFAVSPSTLLTRWILLDSLLIPLVLASILFATLCLRETSSKNRKFLFTFVSGMFMGLAIFTKIPAFTMIPLVSYLIYVANRKHVKNVGLWFIPVIIIPALWPLHAISVNEFDLWWGAITWQTHREAQSLYSALTAFYNFDWILLIAGISGTIYAAIRRDRFILLYTVPFLLFMYALGHVVLIHLMLLFVIFSISGAKLIVDVAYYLKKKKQILHLSSVGFIVVIVILSFTSTTKQIVANENSQFFKAADFLQGYLRSTNKNISLNQTNNDTSVVSHPFFIWVEKYKFKNENNDFWPNKQFETSKIVFVIDPIFRRVIQQDVQYGAEFKELFSAFYTKPVASFKDPEDTQDKFKVDILETDLHNYNKSKLNVLNILGEHQTWNQSKYVHLYRQNGSMNITVDTDGADVDNNLNYIIFNKTINFFKPYGYIGFTYYVPKTSDATYKFDIVDAKDNSTLWEYGSYGDPETTGLTKEEFFILPQELYNKDLFIQMKVESFSKKVDSILLKNFTVYS